MNTMFYKIVYWENVKSGEKVTTDVESNKGSILLNLLCDKSYGRKSCQIGHCQSYSQGNLKACLFFLKKEGVKVEGFVFSTKHRPSSIPTGWLETPLMLSSKSPRYLTHQKIKNFLAQHYSWNFEAKNDNETEAQDEEAIKIVIEKVEDSEVVKPKKDEKPPQIHNSDDEDVEEDYSEVIKLRVKRKTPLIEDTEIESNIIVEK